MATLDTLRDNIIDKLLAISNKEYLVALNRLVEKSDMANEPVQLTESQINMLKLSDKDIEEGRLIPHEDVMKNNLEWLRQL